MVHVPGHLNASTRVTGRGQWWVELGLEQGGPYNMTVYQLWVSVEPQWISINNVMVGEVWLCVGSDTMALPMTSVTTPDNIRDDINISSVRYAELRTTWTEEPQVEIIAFPVLTSNIPDKVRFDWRSETKLDCSNRRNVVNILCHVLDVWQGTEPEVTCYTCSSGSCWCLREQHRHVVLVTHGSSDIRMC